jgi:hypothetical protein
MTTPTDDPLRGVLLSIRRADTLLGMVFILLQSWLFFMTYAESRRLDAERARNEQRHQEVMESLNAARASVTQSIQLQLRNGRFEEIREKHAN